VLVASAGEPVGLFHAWWQGDPLPDLPSDSPSLSDVTIEPCEDAGSIAAVIGTERAAVEERLQAGHRPWLARVADEPVGWGWVATRRAMIGELGLAFALPPSNSYLWDCFTLPAWRCRGVYTRLLRAIVRGEAARRFWVGHDIGNVASKRGIAHAGFREVGAVYRLPGGELRLAATASSERVAVASALFGVPLAQSRFTAPK
jgi:hypothetical protein